ncbi:MAG: molybdopterin-guanine dinucleotide biosynthesis protein B, partial [Anaerolineae bacterium]
MATPIISVIGKSKSGKTTFLEKLVPILAGRGYRVATVKHHSHPGFEMDQPGKDSWRHFQAGASVSVVAAPDKMAVVQRLDDERSLQAIARQIALTAPVDLIITEGYSQCPAMKIEVVRAERST